MSFGFHKDEKESSGKEMRMRFVLLLFDERRRKYEVFH